MRLFDKTAMITGAAKGLGRAMAESFAKEGATVFVADIDEEKGRAVAQSLGSAAHYIHLDVTSELSWKTAIAEVHQLDILVNNAGVTSVGTIEQVTPERFRNEFDVDVLGVMLGCRFGIAKMKGSVGGSIINISSATAEINEPELAVYAAAKTAVCSVSKNSALYCAKNKLGIRVNTILPGIIHTDMLDFALSHVAEEERAIAMDKLLTKSPLGRLGDPREVSAAAIYLASDTESGFTTGTNLFVDGGISI